MPTLRVFPTILLLLWAACAQAYVHRPFNGKRETTYVSRRAPHSTEFWLASTEGPTHGVIRARFNHPKKLDATVVFRGTVKNNLLLSGYGVHLHGRRVEIVRWVPGAGSERIGDAGRLRRVGNKARLEVVITVLGAAVVASVYDISRKKFIGHASATGLAAQGHAIGLLGSPPDSKSRLIWLSGRTACPVGRAPKFHKYGIGKGHVVIELPKAVRAPKRSVVLEITEKTIAYRTDPAGLEALHCAGQTPSRLITTLPWKYVQPSYLAARDQRPRWTRKGYALGRTYKSPKTVEMLLRGWHAHYPNQTRLVEIGQTHQGRPILALGIAEDIVEDDPRPSILLNGAHHGDEPMSVEFVLDAIDQLLRERGSQTRRWRKSLVVWAVPMVNPDGSFYFFELTKNGGRKNGRDLNGDGARDGSEGVDLNRNYPFKWGVFGEEGSKSDPKSRYFRGSVGGSEPETRAIMKLANAEHFAASISYHSGTIAVLAPYTTDEVPQTEPNIAWQVAENLVDGLEKHPQGRQFKVKKNLYPVDGVDQDWLYHTHGTLALLVEGAAWTALDQSHRDAIVEVVRPTWKRLLDRFLRGPSLSGRVLNAEGDPVEATVRIAEVKTLAGERWMIRARDGRFDRIVPHPGHYTVQVELSSGEVIERRVKVGRRNTFVEIRLP